MQESNFIVEVRPCKRHGIIGHLSRLNEEPKSKVIDNLFPDAQLFYIDVIPREYDEIIEYL